MERRESDTRLAVLEQIAAAHEKRIANMEEFYRTVVDRLDQKIQLDASSQMNLERNLTRAVTTLEQLTQQMSQTYIVSERADKIAAKHEVILVTTVKIIGFSAVVVSGLWAVFKYFAGA